MGVMAFRSCPAASAFRNHQRQPDAAEQELRQHPCVSPWRGGHHGDEARQQHRGRDHDEKRLCPGQALMKQPVLDFGRLRHKAPGQPIDTAARDAVQARGRWFPLRVAVGGILFKGHPGQIGRPGLHAC
jgi:hypothetical protein